MLPVPPKAATQAAARFVNLVGIATWNRRIAELRDMATTGPRSGQAVRQRHAVELTIDRFRRPSSRAPSQAELILMAITAEACAIAGSLSPQGRDRLKARIAAGLTGDSTLLPLFHMLRTGMLQRSRGFDVHHAGLDDGADFDLLLRRQDATAEVACEVVSAEEGRGVHRGAWFRLADRIDPDLQTWLSAHPGRYLLKMTLAQGLNSDLSALAGLHERIRGLLTRHARQDHDEAIVLRLDPLLLAGAHASDAGLMTSLRREFGPEAHLSVTTAGNGVFVMAARAGREDEIAVAIRRRLSDLAPRRLSGKHPGILALFVDDTNRDEWQGLRDRLELEGETRQFLTNPEARPVVAVTFASRIELFGYTDGPAPDGDLRFRNPGHPAARSVALSPAVFSSI